MALRDLIPNKKLMEDIGRLNPSERKKVLEAIGQSEFEKCAEDIFYWIDSSRHPDVPYVYTQDQHPLHVCNICKDGATHHFNKRAIHLEMTHNLHLHTFQEVGAYFSELPTTRTFTVMEYMPPIIESWLKDQFVFVRKSRDMMATWLTVTMYAWDSLFHNGRQNIFQSDDATKTCDLVRRAYFIWKNQPSFLRNVHKAQYAAGQTRSGILTVESLGSEILGFPQGADQIRQYHPTGVFQDEAAFQVEAGAAFMAIKPSIQQGGRFTAVSSANLSWFWMACEDRSDESL